MPDEMPTPTTGFLSAFAYPSWVVMMVAQMVLGLALFVCLIVKYYMLVFGTLICTADGESLGNMIRCTTTLEIVAHFVLGVAGLRFAACLFVDNARALLMPLMIAVIGVVILYVSQLSIAGASWAVAAVLVSLILCLSALFAAQYLTFFNSEK